MSTAEWELGLAAREAGVRAHVSRHWMSWCDVTVVHPAGSDARAAHAAAKGLPNVAIVQTVRDHLRDCYVSLGTLCLAAA